MSYATQLLILAASIMSVLESSAERWMQILQANLDVCLYFTPHGAFTPITVSHHHNNSNLENSATQQHQQNNSNNNSTAAAAFATTKFQNQQSYHHLSYLDLFQWTPFWIWQTFSSPAVMIATLENGSWLWWV